VEVLVVVGLVTLLLGATLFFDVQGYRSDAFRAERTKLVTALQTARANALNNMQQSSHGVAINPGGYAGYVIFSGESYALSSSVTHISIPASYSVTLDGASPQEVVFSALSGDTGWSGELVLQDPERQATSAIIINYEGKIGW
jgi:Tfp pilus assembly protein FimT